jgi:hypothetical protein
VPVDKESKADVRTHKPKINADVIGAPLTKNPAEYRRKTLEKEKDHEQHFFEFLDIAEP